MSDQPPRVLVFAGYPRGRDRVILILPPSLLTVERSEGRPGPGFKIAQRLLESS